MWTNHWELLFAHFPCWKLTLSLWCNGYFYLLTHCWSVFHHCVKIPNFENNFEEERFVLTFVVSEVSVHGWLAPGRALWQNGIVE